MIDFGSVMKIKNAWDTFNRNHPKFMPFCQAVGRDGIGVDTIIEVKSPALMAENITPI